MGRIWSWIWLWSRDIVGAALARPLWVDGAAQPSRVGAENTGGIPQRWAQFPGPLTAQQHHLSSPVLQKSAVGAFSPATLGRIFEDMGGEVIQHETVTQSRGQQAGSCVGAAQNLRMAHPGEENPRIANSPWDKFKFVAFLARALAAGGGPGPVVGLPALRQSPFLRR